MGEGSVVMITKWSAGVYDEKKTAMVDVVTFNDAGNDGIRGVF